MSCRTNLFLFLFTCLEVYITCQESYEPAYTWECNNKKCERTLSLEGPYKSVEVCRIACGDSRSIWPKPVEVTNFSTNLFQFHPNFITFNYEVDPEGFFTSNLFITRNDLFALCGTNAKCSVEDTQDVVISFEISTTNTSLFWDTDESYILTINMPHVTIKARTVFGVRHGLETFKQLCASYEQNGEYILVTIQNGVVTDKPKYPHRGLMLDTARHYVSMEAIKRQINAMAASKMNVFHWHISDSQSFPYVSKQVPQLAKYGAYSKNEVYQYEDVKNLVAFAKQRGVRIIFEIDAPAHAGHGWQFGPLSGLGNLSLCIDYRPYNQYCIQPPCGQLNPVNDNLYPILGKLYKDLIDTAQRGEVFHMGGDEVFVNCWNSSAEIQDYLNKNNITPNKEAFLDLWAMFQQRALEQFDMNSDQTVPIMMWTSDLTQPDVILKYLDKDRYVIQSWVYDNDKLPEKLAELGYKVVISTKNKYYLDHGFWGSTEFHKWQDIYSYKFLSHQNVLGGEACSWGEYIDDSGIDSRVWPRAAAVAERLWSNPETNIAEAQIRLANLRNRLVRLGIQAQAVIPEWCYQTEGQCS